MWVGAIFHYSNKIQIYLSALGVLGVKGIWVVPPFTDRHMLLI